MQLFYIDKISLLQQPTTESSPVGTGAVPSLRNVEERELVFVLKDSEESVVLPTRLQTGEGKCGYYSQSSKQREKQQDVKTNDKES